MGVGHGFEQEGVADFDVRFIYSLSSLVYHIYRLSCRLYFHVQCNNQTHVVGPNIRYTKHTAGATMAVAHVIPQVHTTGTPVFALFDLLLHRSINSTVSSI